MKSKSAEKLVHVVPWINKAEWDQVLEYMYSNDAVLQKYALQRISAWKSRFGSSTPIAVESTADLVRCQVLDSSGHLDADDLVLLYGTALVRFVNLITERKQKKVATSLRRLADKMNIPEWIVNLRHDITHHKLPTLKFCRKGCKFVLAWLQQEYWSRQLGGQLDEHWDSQSDKEEEDDPSGEDELAIRKRDNAKKARELLISYENEQFQTFDKLHKKGRDQKQWCSSSSDLHWILIQIKDFAMDCSDALIDTLLMDGYLVPTMEQLESLDIDPADTVDPTVPSIPRLFLRFWQPLLKALLTDSFVWLFLEKLFAELHLSGEFSQHRTCYIAGWISEIFSFSSFQIPNTNASKGQKKAWLRDQIFAKQITLPWKKLLMICLDAPCLATPHLLQQIMENMDPPLPVDTQKKLLRLCCIYTQADDFTCSSAMERGNQPVYTLESLQKMLWLKSKDSATGDSLCPGGTLSSLQNTSIPVPVPEVAEDLQEQLSAEILAERAAALRGSPWQVCVDNVKWKHFPLGKVPGQSEDPSYLMAENYSTMSVFDQHIEADKAAPHSNFTSTSGHIRSSSDGPVWTHNDLNKLKSGLQLF
ncbi:ribosomal biogenesis protein LAS1L [Brienomyrus brachyistius]|uniref:ribosomal biogenesis protein LAS1L n=1 Tax=Brienomyrus brachyistius TaxID=42636 RepID=UPI0020B25BC8|nr:ribosomal biogenesis protein LAS1L [Brienomyrus brachyistius]